MDLKVIFSTIIITLAMMLIPEHHILCQNPSVDVGLRTVVIDPGHGGKDPGAPGADSKTSEKHIVLKISKLLGEKIKNEYPDVKLYVAGYKYEEIAEILDIPLGTVKSRIFTTRQKLRSILHDYR